VPASKHIPFIKASACGNVFLLVDGITSPEDSVSLAHITRELCDPKNGVGADGVEWIYLPTDKTKADLRVRLFNADGGEAEISGNGTRCVAMNYIMQHGGEFARIETAAGIKSCRLVHASSKQYEFETAMGVPKIESEYKRNHLGIDLNGVLLNMGNPQCVIFVDEFPDNWQALGAHIQAQPQFPNGVNIDFVRVTGPNSLDCRFFERGAGETMSSGTGSCASAVAAIHANRVQSPVIVQAPGGSQTVRWDDSEGMTSSEVLLAGPAEIIDRREFTLQQ